MKKKIKDIKFEDHLKHAKEIVEKLESGDCSLDEMLNLYEQGVNSLKICSKQLSEFELADFSLNYFPFSYSFLGLCGLARPFLTALNFQIHFC